jgi:hypothetical protein
MMAPLERHFDYGFGATGDAFHGAAQALEKHQGENGVFFFEHLPINFLLRHAVELYLKSGIIIIHRRLGIPFDTEPPDSAPMVKTGNKWKPIDKIHSIATLFSYWNELVVSNVSALDSVAKVPGDWAISPELCEAINMIEQTDSGGTYYRYPLTKEGRADAEKSPFKEITSFEDLFPSKPSEGKAVMALVIENEEGEFVRAFSKDDNTETEQSKALSLAAMHLHNFHAMTRFILTDTW